MYRFYAFISKNRERFILFSSGVIISAVVSEVLEKSIAWSIASLIVATIIVIVAAVYFFSESARRILTLANRMETTVYYVEELYREHEGIRFKGIIFGELKKLVSRAKNEILVLATSTFDGKAFVTQEHSSREQYFLALEETIVRNQDKDFKYVRIAQIPHENKNLPVINYLGTVTADHCRRTFEIERSSQPCQLSLSFMQVPIQKFISFMIIDRRYILLAVDGLDTDGNPYAAGIFVLEDKEGTLVNRFLWYFDNLERLAKPITLADLDAKQ
jgi:hypothetical protein